MHLTHRIAHPIVVLLAATATAVSLASVTQAAEGTVAVRVDAEDAAAVADIEAIHSVDHGAFLWLELDAAGLAALDESGVGYQRQLDPGAIELHGVTIDTTAAASFQALSQSIAGGGAGLRLVQLTGPARDEWIEDLEAQGVEILQYIAPYGYLVWTTLDDGALTSFESVRWAGPYPAEVRIGPDLRSRSGMIENVDVEIYDDGNVETTIAAIENLGGSLVERESRTGSDSFVTASFALPSSALDATSQLGTVGMMGHRPPVFAPDDEMSDQIIAGNFAPLAAGYGTWLTNNAVNGNGITVALIDSGYDTGVDGTSHQDVSGRTTMLNTPTDNNGHGTHVGGIMVGNANLGTQDASNFLMGLGVAPQANLVVRFFSGTAADLQQAAVTNGAVASNNSYGVHDASLGYLAADRTLDILVRDADQSTAAIEPLVMVFSAGNCGNAPASSTCNGNNGPTKEAKNIIAVGNSLNNRDGAGNPGTGNINNMASGSSRGPAQDGRTYPHVSAPGTNIISTRSMVGAVSCLTTPTDAPVADPTYSMCSGTSMAAPHVTGSVALLTQWWQGFNGGANPSPAIAKALLVNGATDMGTADIPNNNEGWGRINLSNVINTGLASYYEDQVTVFGTTGATWSSEFIPDDSGQPVKVTLAWSDAPGAAGANPALVNDLDLTVTESGTSYLGNDFAGGTSTTGGAADTLNNLENVFLAVPTGDSFVVAISASAIVGDGIPGNADTTDQDFALVIQNAVEVATVNVVKLVDDDYDGVFDDDPAGWSFDVDDDGNVPQATGATGMLTFKVLPGTYAINETDGPGGLWLTTASCEDDDTGASVGTGVIAVENEPPQTLGVSGVTLVAQQSITCTFLNEADEAFINIVKRVDAQPDGIFDDDPTGWTFDVFDDGQLGQTTDASGALQFVVRPDSYQVWETDHPDTGFWLVSAQCEDDDTLAPVGMSIDDVLFGPGQPPAVVSDVDLVGGQSVTCYFDNQKMAGFLTGGGNIRSKRGRNALYITWGGNVGIALDGSTHGQWQANFHFVGNPNVSGSHFHSESIDMVVFNNDALGEPPNPPSALFNNASFEATGRFADMTCSVSTDATDHGEPARGKNSGGDSDSIRIVLDCPGTDFDYDSADDFGEEEEPDLHNLDGGNLQIHPPRE